MAVLFNKVEKEDTLNSVNDLRAGGTAGKAEINDGCRYIYII
jgi:hypothetical protein